MHKKVKKKYVAKLRKRHWTKTQFQAFGPNDNVNFD